MQQSKQHAMLLEKTHPSGAEEWFCPECGRRFILHFQPEFEQLNVQVLEAGDEYANHSGSRGGLRISNTEASVVDNEQILSNDLRLALDEALKDIDFGD